MIYGDYIGEMPSGKMSWKLHPAGTVPCATYEAYDTWVIDYSFYDGYKDGVKYRGTRRIAYLPDTKEGREVMLLLIK